MNQTDLYFIECAGRIKIGKAKHVHSRISGMTLPYKHKVLAIWRNSGEREKHIHSRFAEHRKYGEWFSKDPEILEFIQKVIKGEMSFMTLAKRKRRHFL